MLHSVSEPREAVDPQGQLRLAARIARDAAEALAAEATNAREAARYANTARRLGAVLDADRHARSRILLASPSLVERSGRTRTLVEMIEADPGDDQARARLARLLLRALDWRPESLPFPAG